VKPSIEASAGTGKTTRVVRLLLERLLGGDAEPSRLLALTFTVRAANEMRDRLGLWLTRLCAGETVHELGGGLEVFGDVDTVRRRGLVALAELDRAEIGTIHAFAAQLLRQYPLEAGVAPEFQEDDGREAAALFRDRWPRWLEGELGDPGTVAFVAGLLERMEVRELEAFARGLCEEGVPLALAPAPGADVAWRERLAEAAARARDLRTRHADETTKTARRACEALAVAEAVFGAPAMTPALRAQASRLRVAAPRRLAAWSDADATAWDALVRLARVVAEVDDDLVTRLLAWLRPFVETFRAELVRRGRVSFQGLIVRAGRVLREHRDVREQLKRRFRLIVVDEFQDTDPEQSALLLFLAEREGACERDWRRVEIAPGKLVIVGDPKQSIYLFRGADLEAYRALATRLTGGREDAVERLAVNYRARHELVAFVNAVGRHVMRNPPYAALEPAPQTGAGGQVDLLLFPGRTAAAARAAEADAIAAWIAAGTAGGAFAAGDVALLLRALPDAPLYTEALRRAGVDFVIEGEKHFHAAQEVVDVMNLLLATADPTDELAVVGLLRSPLGAVPDRELVRLREADALSPLDPDRVPATLPHVRRLYEAIALLHAEARRLPAVELLDAIVARFPVLAIARATPRGEQAVANVEKLLRSLAATGGLTLGEALAEFRRRSREGEDEGEAPLADERLDAVRILSIHKAKGLEFPIVVLPDLHRGEGPGGEGPVLRDWLAGVTGFRCGRLRTRERVALEERVARIRDEETDRLLYVALTRARDRLVLTGGDPQGSVFLSRVLAALAAAGVDVAGDAAEEARVGPGFTLRVERRTAVVPLPSPAPPAASADAPDWPALQAAWAARERAARRAAATPPIRRPSLPTDPDVDRVVRLERDDDAGDGRSLGTACHDLLATLDLARPAVDPTGPAADVVRGFVVSDAFREIASADEVYREVPFVIELDGEVWSGQLDVLYRTGARWIVADWKSDRAEHPGRYRLQARVYARAVQQLLRLDAPPEFRLVYLRSGRAVAVAPHSS
jgi:ATP-dependent helicase/nuclease subunit A